MQGCSSPIGSATALPPTCRGKRGGAVVEPQMDEFVCVGEKDDDDVEILSWTSPASEGGEANNYTNICCFGSPAFFSKAPMPS